MACSTSESSARVRARRSGWPNDCIDAETVNSAPADDRPLPLQIGHSCEEVERLVRVASTNSMVAQAVVHGIGLDDAFTNDW